MKSPIKSKIISNVDTLLTYRIHGMTIQLVSKGDFYEWDGDVFTRMKDDNTAVNLLLSEIAGGRIRLEYSIDENIASVSKEARKAFCQLDGEARARGMQLARTFGSLCTRLGAGRFAPKTDAPDAAERGEKVEKLTAEVSKQVQDALTKKGVKNASALMADTEGGTNREDGSSVVLVSEAPVNGGGDPLASEVPGLKTVKLDVYEGHQGPDGTVTIGAAKTTAKDKDGNEIDPKARGRVPVPAKEAPAETAETAKEPVKAKAPAKAPVKEEKTPAPKKRATARTVS